MRSLASIIDNLIENTAAGKLDWSRDIFNKAMFVVNIGSSVIKIWEWTDPGDESEGITLALFKDGIKIDDVIANQYEIPFSKLNELYRGARRKVNNVDTVIGDLLEHLSK